MLASFTEAIHQATRTVLQDGSVHIMGLGAVYPNGLDGTLSTLAAEFPNNVHDVPCSEAAITGMCVGAVINGLKLICHHGRIEFALYASNQILTEAANWNYEFGGYPCPLTIRVAIGRQWGNGPAHTRANKGLFAVPGLKVVCPSTPQMAHDLLIASVRDNNPVIYLEPRWLYKLRGEVSDRGPIDLGKARVIKHGRDITVVAIGDMLVEVLKAAKLVKPHVDVEIIDLVSVYPIDEETVLTSVARTRNLLVCESSPYPYSTASQVVQCIGMEGDVQVNALTCPDYPCPTAPSLTKNYYPTSTVIANEILFMCGVGKKFPSNETFAQLNLPPTDNIDELLAEIV